LPPYDPSHPTAAEALAIDPTLDPAAMAGAFRRFGRLHIPGFLAASSADGLSRTLEGETGWLRSIIGGGRGIDVPVAALESLPAAQRASYLPPSDAVALDGLFDMVRVITPPDDGAATGPGYEALARFLNGPAFLGFIRTLTGDGRPAHVDAQATRFLPGHYLTQHDDSNARYGRLYAYVLSLTPSWRPDWGGLLNFIDDDGHVAEAYTPAFNALNVFRVPQQHSVGIVAPFAQGARYSVTGWIHDRHPRTPLPLSSRSKGP